MKYIKELDLFEIECDLEMVGSHAHAGLKIIPKKCPGGKGICKESLPYPIHGNSYTCEYYVRMTTDTGEPGIWFSNKLYCRGHNSIKFIMED